MKATSLSKIFIICPANNSTGGPEALHQLCHKLETILNLEAKIVYINKKLKKDPKPQAYTIYNTKEADEIIDDENNILIIPESLTNYIYKYPNIQKVIWWLSIDFFKICMKNRHRGLLFYINKFILRKKGEREYLLEDLHNVYQWAQSHRSYLYLLDKKISKDKIEKVCDYMNPIFLKSSEQKIALEEKEDIIIYNPKKGKAEISSIIKKYSDYQWIPIQKMTSLEVSYLMRKAKLFIDFGYNPGRDRMLRESALMKCVIISGKNGSSFYQEDLNIPEEYKFEYSIAQIPQIIAKIQDVLTNYNTHILNFEGYIQETYKEEQKFEQKLKLIFKTDNIG